MKKFDNLVNTVLSKLNEGDVVDSSQFDPRLNPAEISNRPDHSYKEPSFRKRRDPENYKYDFEGPRTSSDSTQEKDRPYKNKRTGQKFVDLSDKEARELGLKPRTYSLGKTIISGDGKTKFELKWNEDAQKIEKIDLGTHELDQEPTEYGVPKDKMR